MQDSTKLSVVLTVGSLGERYGGPSRTVTGLASALARHGVSIDVVAGLHSRIDGTIVAPASREVGVHAATVWQAGPVRLYPDFAHQLVVLTAGRSGGLIHDNGLWGHNNYQAWSAARNTGVPYVLSPRGMIEPWALNHKAWKKRIALAMYQRRILEGSALFFATAPAEYESIRRAGLKGPVAIVPNGIDNIDPDPGTPPEVQDDCQRPRIALFLSRIQQKKGLINLLQAWAKVNGGGWLLRLAGPDEGGHLREVLRTVRDLGLTDRVQYIGSVSGEEKRRVYREADIFVLPTFSENFGVVVAEALAFGVPVITTKGAPWRDIETHGCGWWIDIGVEPLVSALSQAIALSDEERRVMGLRGRDLIRIYDWNDIAGKTLAAYRWILGLGSRPDFVHLD